MHSPWQEQNDTGGSRLALPVEKGHPMLPQRCVLGLSCAAKRCLWCLLTATLTCALLVGGRPLPHLYSPEPRVVTANSAELHEIDNIRLEVTWNLYLQIINFMTPLHIQ